MNASNFYFRIVPKGIYLAFPILAILLTSCPSVISDPPPLEQGTAYKPIIMERATLESSIAFSAATELNQTGKIYSYGIYILINEKYEGIHVFKNADPRNPEKIGFIRIPGCVDMAVKNNILYADNAVDLVAIDISALPEINITKRVASVFPELTPPDLTYVPQIYSEQRRPENTVIVKWVLI